MESDLELLNAPAEIRAAYSRADKEVVVEVLYANRRAYRTFMACQTQWRVAGLGGLLGLDYTAVKAAMEMLGVRRVRDTFNRIRVIEGAALKELARRRPRPKQ